MYKNLFFSMTTAILSIVLTKKRKQKMDVGGFLAKWTGPVILAVAIIGGIYIAYLGFKHFLASDPAVAIETKNKLNDSAIGLVMTIIFIFLLSAIVRWISGIVYWP